MGHDGNKVAELPVHLLTPRGSSLEKGYKPRMFITCNLKKLLLGSLLSGGLKSGVTCCPLRAFLVVTTCSMVLSYPGQSSVFTFSVEGLRRLKMPPANEYGKSRSFQKPCTCSCFRCFCCNVRWDGGPFGLEGSLLTSNGDDEPVMGAIGPLLTD
jgi:hypothetical protein